MNKSKILIVDDDSKVTRLLADILGRMGSCEALEENRSFAAVRTARRFRPDLILLDVDMPGKDGGVVFAELGNDALLANTPVLFVTSLISGSECGVHAGRRYLSKPIDPSRLREAVRTMCPRF